jgi:hypothetical protein
MKYWSRKNRHELQVLHKLPRYTLGEKEMMCVEQKKGDNFE